MNTWEERYQSRDTPWDKGAPAPALPEALARVPLQGRVLVPGCGHGHDAAWLARSGLEVTGVDLAPSAIAEAARQYSLPDLSFQQADLFALPPALHGAFDGVFEHTCFCAISPADRPRYAEAVAQVLRPGGVFLAIFYLQPDREAGEAGPPFGTTLAELDGLFSPAFLLEGEWLPSRAFPGREGREWVRAYRKRPAAPGGEEAATLPG